MWCIVSGALYIIRNTAPHNPANLTHEENYTHGNFGCIERCASGKTSQESYLSNQNTNYD